jgi:hypothetical protein
MFQFLVILLDDRQTYLFADGLYEAIKAAERKFGAFISVNFIGA